MILCNKSKYRNTEHIAGSRRTTFQMFKYLKYLNQNNKLFLKISSASWLGISSEQPGRLDRLVILGVLQGDFPLWETWRLNPILFPSDDPCLPLDVSNQMASTSAPQRIGHSQIRLCLPAGAGSEIEQGIPESPWLDRLEEVLEGSPESEFACLLLLMSYLPKKRANSASKAENPEEGPS